LKDSRYLEKTQDFITIDGLNNSSSNLIAKNSVIVCTRMGLGKIAINTIDVAINQDLKALQLFEEIEKDYFYIFYKTLEISGSGMTVSGIKQSELLNFIVPLPPLEEQKRIVKKVDELMTLVDRLEHAQTEKARTRSKLSKASFAALANAQNASEFTESWQRVSRHFSELVKTQEDLQTLRQTILQLAVQGKLTEQRAEDGDAREELTKLIDQKFNLISTKEAQSFQTKPIEEIDLSLKFPNSWSLCRLGQIAIKLGAGSTPKGGNKVYKTSGVKFIRSQNVWNDGLYLEGVAFISQEIHNAMQGSTVKPKDVLLNITGASIGRSCVVPDTFDEGNVNQHVAIVRLVDLRLRHFVHLTLISNYIQDLIMNVQVGISREGLSMSRLKDFVVPLPPLAEQKRIVAKVDSLMAVCDRLEALLSQQQSTAERLVGAVVQGLAA
jgi:type I restriction enzyme, S subunit